MTDVERIITIICEVGKLPEVGPDQDLQEAGFTSMSVLQLLVELEDAFGVSIPDDKYMECHTPNDLCRMIEGLKVKEIA
jgi:acyl carrier protein